MTLLQQLEFFFEARDQHTQLNVTNHTLTLMIKNGLKPDQVAKIASRMGMTITGDPIQISMSALMKEAPPKPNTPFQQALINLINGDEKYIGLQELLSYYIYDYEYGWKGRWYFQGSKLEYTYLKSGGWNIMPDDTLNTQKQTHPLWLAFEKEWSKTTFFLASEPGRGCVRHEVGTWSRGERIHFPFHDKSDEKYTDPKSFRELLERLTSRLIVFSNGGNISFSKEKKEGKAYSSSRKENLELVTPIITIPSQFESYKNLLKYGLIDGNSVLWHREHGRLSEYLDV